MSSKLLSIPAELLASIADDLDLPSYGNLRLCCKQTEDFTFTYFAKKFFGTRKFFRSHISLDALLTISESRFGPYLETVVLGTVLLDADPPCGSDTVSTEAYLRAYAEQTSMLASGWDRDMLVAAFENLPNLSGIATEVFDDRVPWDDGGGDGGGDGDGSPVQVDSRSYGGYGLKTMLRGLRFEAGMTPPQGFGKHQWVSAVQLLLAAAARARVRPRTFRVAGNKGEDDEIYYYSASTVLGVGDDAFYIPSFMRQMILPVIEGLTELDLDVHNRHISSLGSASCRSSSLREFIGIPTNLQKLRIRRLWGGEGSRSPAAHEDDFWAWIGEDHKGKNKAPPGGGDQDTLAQHIPGSSSSLFANAMVSPPPFAFPHLQELEISHQDVRVDDLMRLLRKVSPTLRKVSLHKLILRDRAADPTEDEDDNVRAEVGLWAGLCGEMAAVPWAELYEVDMSGFGGLGGWHLGQFDYMAGLDAVHFTRLRMTGEDMYSALAEFSYRGLDGCAVLRQLADDLRAAVRDGRHVFDTSYVGTGTRRRSF